MLALLFGNRAGGQLTSSPRTILTPGIEPRAQAGSHYFHDDVPASYDADHACDVIRLVFPRR